jgi:chromosome segregation ATPase
MVLSFLGSILRTSVAAYILCDVAAASQLRFRRSGDEVTPAAPPSEQFSATAQAALANMTNQLAEFQKVVVEHSSRFQALLQAEEHANAGIQAFSVQIEAVNANLTVSNAMLAKEATQLIVNNSQLRTELKGMERKLRVAQQMAATVGAFHADGAEQDENAAAEALSADGDVAAVHPAPESLLALVIQTRTTLAGGAKDLAQEEEDAIAQLQKSGEQAFAEAKKRHTVLVQEQAQLNSTRASLEGRRAKLISTLGRLDGTNKRLQVRYTALTSLFMRLAGVAQQ